MPRGFTASLQSWYARAHRDLPWRRTSNPYEILVSEIMLQQTRAQAAIPYFERFLERFPSVESLATAAEADVLACWSGLGYYSRARNLRKAAAEILNRGEFPRTMSAIRELPGVGPYTAAAVASIAFAQPHAVLDGNVMRVIARLKNDAADIATLGTRRRFQAIADGLLDPANPGTFNQAMMELGATVCVPRDPRCGECPVRNFCAAAKQGTARQLPVKLRSGVPENVECSLALIERGARLLLRQRAPGARRMADFWELPSVEEIPDLRDMRLLGSFRHTIVRQRHRVLLYAATIARKPRGHRWFSAGDLAKFPVTTITRKALAIAGRV